MRISDWSSDVCSSDLGAVEQPVRFARMPESLGRHFGRIAIFRGFFNAALAQNLQFLFLRKAPVRKIRRGDRKSVVKGTSVSVRVDLGGRRNIHKNKSTKKRRKDVHE